MFSVILASRSDFTRLAVLAIWMCLQSASAAPVAPVKIATWNLDWLTLLPQASALLPDDAPHRTNEDWQALRHYALRLNADILAVQEVSDEATLRRIFPSPDYVITLSKAPIAQNLGLVLRKPWHVDRAVSIQEFDRSSSHGGHALRPALDAIISNGTATLRLLVVHLKSGCWDRSWMEKAHSCPILREQIMLVANWLEEREDEGEAYAVLGDFNRRLTMTDPYLRHMIGAYSPILSTAGLASPCEGGTYFIDHILLGGPTRSWLVPESLRVMTFQTDNHQVISDHCPVSLQITPPDQAKYQP